MVKLVTSFVFKDHINRVYEAFTSIELIKDLYPKEYMCGLEVKNGKTLADLGVERTFTWKMFTKVKAKVVESINEQFYKKTLEACESGDPLNFKCSFIRYFYWNSVQRSTIVVFEFTSEDPKFINNFKEHENFEDQMTIFKRFEEHLQKTTTNLEQTESIVLNTHIKKVWEVITNWNLFNNISDLLCESVEYFGNNLEIGTKFKTIFNSKKSEFYYKIINIVNTDDKCEYIVECYAGSPSCPKQKLHFKLRNIANKLCFLEFQHIFTEAINYSSIHYISKEKKIMLSLLKKHFN